MRRRVVTIRYLRGGSDSEHDDSKMLWKRVFGGADIFGRVKINVPTDSYVAVHIGFSRARDCPRLLKDILRKFTRSDAGSRLSPGAPHTFMRAADIVTVGETSFVLSPTGFQKVEFKPPPFAPARETETAAFDLATPPQKVVGESKRNASRGTPGPKNSDVTVTASISGGLSPTSEVATVKLSDLTADEMLTWVRLSDTTGFLNQPLTEAIARGFDLLLYTIQTNNGHTLRTTGGSRQVVVFVNSVLNRQKSTETQSEPATPTPMAPDKKEPFKKKAPQKKEVQKDDLWPTSPVRVGDLVRVRRYDSVSTGYSWEVASSPNLILKRTDIESTSESRQHIPGAGTYKVWTFQASAPGRGLVYLLNKRAWEPDTDSDHPERLRVDVLA